MTLRVDAVIPTNRRDHLLPGVVGPLLGDLAIERVIVVDDDPSSSLSRHDEDDGISTLSDRVTVVRSGGVGPAAARQVGAEAAEADLILFLDDDVVPPAGLAGQHVRAHDAEDHLVVCGYSPVVPREGRTLSPEATVYGIAYEKRCRVYDSGSHFVLTHFWGGNFSLRREDALRVGLASSEFPDYWHEDRDFGLRCLDAGLRADFDRDIFARHEHERTWSAVAAESYGRGYSLVRLHNLHQSTIGPFDEHHYERGLPKPLKWVVRASAHPLGNWIARASVRTLREACAVLRIWRLQLIAVRLLRRIQGARGARDGLRELGPARAPVEGTATQPTV
jgi:GT2 family glycosyltransferase